MSYNDIITEEEAKFLVGITSFDTKVKKEFIGNMPRKDEIKYDKIKYDKIENIYTKIYNALKERSEKEPDIKIKNKLEKGCLEENYEIKLLCYGEEGNNDYYFFYRLWIGIKDDKNDYRCSIFRAVYHPGKEENEKKKYVMNLFDKIDEEYRKKNPPSKTLWEEFLGRGGSSRKL